MTLKVDGTNGILQAYDYQVLTTGFSYTFAAGTTTLIANPAGTLATGTVTMPAAPADGMVITFSTTQQITALTVNGNTGQTITSSPTFMAAGSSASYVYNLANTAWRPVSNVPQLLNVPIGVGQTYQSFTVGTQRVNGTTYTNTTGRTIAILIGQSGAAATTILVDGVSIGYVNGAVAPQYEVLIVPPSSTYATGTSAPTSWRELR